MTDEISVVIPTLGRPSLERAVVSAAGQTWPPKEIIVVSNGQHPLDDAFVDQLTQAAAPIPLTALTLPPLSGPSVSRNLGAWQTTADFVAFLDDDDEFSADYLNEMHGVISSKNPDVLYGAKVWRGEEVLVEREKRLSNVAQDQWFDTLYKQINPGFGGQNVVARRSVFFEVGGFPFDLPSGEDRAFAMAVIHQGHEIEYVDAAVVNCHDPQGYRANRRPDKWVTNLKLIYQYWPDVRWGVRLSSLVRWVRSFRAAIMRKHRRDQISGS